MLKYDLLHPLAVPRPRFYSPCNHVSPSRTLYTELYPKIFGATEELRIRKYRRILNVSLLKSETLLWNKPLEQPFWLPVDTGSINQVYWGWVPISKPFQWAAPRLWLSWMKQNLEWYHWETSGVNPTISDPSLTSFTSSPPFFSASLKSRLA